MHAFSVRRACSEYKPTVNNDFGQTRHTHGPHMHVIRQICIIYFLCVNLAVSWMNGFLVFQIQDRCSFSLCYLEVAL
jgi:hypothetical protein